MATATATRKPRTIKAAHGTCGLTLSINGVRYRVRPLDGRGIGAARAFRLAKLAGEGDVYDLAAYPDGRAECDCADYEFSRKGTDHGPCKHLAAARACGLLG
ncbi:MAG TPA: SWIM zinc finger family protein [Isosphaeraceae bacterium]|jgi:hypothetical protein|nr:SWIM zinc finger family protein [Isosphaeraceae bacterium]